MHACRRFGVCASFFERFVPRNREIVFVSFVRASGRGEAACLRERDYVSVAGPPDPRILLRFASSPPPPPPPPLMASDILHVFEIS